MGRVFRKTSYLLAGVLIFAIGVSTQVTFAQKKPKITKVKTPPKKKDDTSGSAEPDKVLYDRAMGDMKHSKFTEARLDLQTLINTYPDSEYLAKAKLGVADSFYKEGGTSNLTQAVEEYKNFIVFFPFLDEAAYAQMQVGMAHYRMTEKPDRDNSQAQMAEDEFREFLLKYPQSPLVPQAEQYLRNVQEILADGEFRIARFYYLKQDYRASAARLVEVSSRYPLYSQSDIALSMLGNIYIRAKQVSKNEDDKNHWADLAAQCYDRILRDYPLSKFAADAKQQLVSMGMPVPAADPGAVERMKKQQEFERQHRENFVMRLPMGVIKSSPNVTDAAQIGTPNLNPPDDLISATEVLQQGAAGPSFAVGRVGGSGSSDSAPAGSEAVSSSDSPASQSVAAAPTPAADSNATAGSDAAMRKIPDNSAPPPPTATVVVPTPVPQTTVSGQPPVTGAPVSESSVPQPPAPPNPAATPAPGSENSQPPPVPASQIVNSGSGSSTAQAPPANSQAAAPPSAPPADSKTESTSKKKKGLHKLVPF